MIQGAQNVVISTKLEATQAIDPMGTPGTADAGTQIGVIGDPTFDFVDDEIARDLRTADYSSFGSVLGKSYATIGVDWEFRGRGAVPTALTSIRELPLLMSGQLTPTYVAGTSMTLNPLSTMGRASNNVTAALYAALDQELRIALGCRAKQIKISLPSGKTGTVHSDLWGIVTRLGVSDFTTNLGIRDQANPASSLDAFSVKPPPILGITFSAAGFSGVKLTNLDITLDYDLDVRDNALQATGIEGIASLGRHVSFVMTIEPELRSSGFDVEYLAEQKTNGVITATIGTAAAGNRMQLVMNASQFSRPKRKIVNKKVLWDIAGVATRNSTAGDDEISWAWLS